MTTGSASGPSRTVWWLLGGTGLAAVAVLVGAVVAASGPSSEPTLPPTTATLPRVTVTAPSPEDLAAAAADLAAGYLDAWSRQDWTAMRLLAGDPPADFASQHVVWAGSLGVTGASFEAGEPVITGDTATVPFAAAVDVAGLGTWEYEGRLALERLGNDWVVDWAPSTIHPLLAAGLRWDVDRDWPPRASILDRNGEALAAGAALVTVGIQPGRVVERAAIADALAPLGVEPGRVDELLDAPGVQPDWFLPVLDLLATRYAEIEDELRPVPGLVFRRATERLPATEELGAHTVGRVGEITNELLQALGAPYGVGDIVGRSGLELAFETRLAGIPTGMLRLVDGDGKQVLRRDFAGTEAAPVPATIDLAVQRAAEAAMAGVEGNAGLVAIDTATGGVLAAVSTPIDGFHRAIAGGYPPGSTFKIVTALAALRAGVGIDDQVECPGVIEVSGREFRNAGDAALGTISFRRAFAESCNTAFIGLALDRTPAELADAAATLGFGSGVGFPLPIAAASFPEPRDRVEQAASAIGQARVLANPLHMAAVAAAVADGNWRAPALVQDDVGADVRPLAPEHAAALREMMRAVVTSGTGTQADVPGAPVHGKTGSAQFDTADPDATHAWFVGFREQIAFAVVVEDGGAGGGVAGPIVAAFLRALDG